MRLRMKSVLAMLLTTGMLAGSLGFLAQAAHAATTPPPFEPDPNARGCLNFYDANGNLVTSGDINSSPPFAYALGVGTPRAGDDNTGTLYAAAPEPGVPSQSWLTQQMSGGNSYPTSDPTVPANLRNQGAQPLYIGAAGDLSLSGMQALLVHNPGSPYAGAYQIRFVTSGPTVGTDQNWWRADIQINGSTWTQTWCPPPAQAQSTTTTLTVSPPSPQQQGTAVNLMASVSPTVAVGTLQFQDNGTNLG